MPELLELILMKIVAFTIPYFNVTERPSAPDEAPLSPWGIFGVDGKGERFIREYKFSVSWSGGLKIGEPSLMVALNPLEEYHDHKSDKCVQPEAAAWVRNNLFWIRHKWKEVLDLLDEQTTLPVC